MSANIKFCGRCLHVCVYTWLRRPIGCLKLQVILRKRGTNNRALLRRMTYSDKASYGSSQPCSETLSLHTDFLTHSLALVSNTCKHLQTLSLYRLSRSTDSLALQTLSLYSYVVQTLSLYRYAGSLYSIHHMQRCML